MRFSPSLNEPNGDGRAFPHPNILEGICILECFASLFICRFRSFDSHAKLRGTTGALARHGLERSLFVSVAAAFSAREELSSDFADEASESNWIIS